MFIFEDKISLNKIEFEIYMSSVCVDKMFVSLNRPMTDKRNEHFLTNLVEHSCPMSIRSLALSTIIFQLSQSICSYLHPFQYFSLKGSKTYTKLNIEFLNMMMMIYENKLNYSLSHTYTWLDLATEHPIELSSLLYSYQSSFD